MKRSNGSSGSPTPLPTELEGIFKATWASWMGDNVRLLDRDARVKDRMIDQQGRSVKVSPGTDDMQNISVDSPSTVTNYSCPTPNLGAWMAAMMAFLLLIVVLLIYALKPQPSPNPIPSPPSPSQGWDVDVSVR